MKQTFILYDGRAKSGDTSEAGVLLCVETEQQAREEGNDSYHGYDAIWAEYDCVDGKTLINERIRWDLPPANKARKRRKKNKAKATGE